MSLLESYVQVRPDVAEALKNARPVVALESALITHGLPWPVNVETAAAAEEAVRRSGSIPATIGVLDGQIYVGLGPDQVRALASRSNAVKAGTRDLAAAVVLRNWAGTTVSATLHIAQRVGIPIMATGGIGGVHRGGAESFDVSNDLIALAHLPVCVVCSGAKAILDIGLTLEKLETYGVPVVGYRTDRFPAFLVRESAFPVTSRVESVDDVARFLRVHWELGGQGVVLAQPPPEPALGEAEWVAVLNLAEKESRGIVGKNLTPFLLQRIAHHTAGRSLEVNRRLIEANAALAGEVAAALSRIKKP